MTSEIISREAREIFESDVRDSIQCVINHAESIWDEWAWQVENKTWTVLGYADWDEMRRGEYGSLTSVSAPRAERPELISRFRGAGLTQKQTADTLGVSERTVKRDDPTEGARGPAKGTFVPFQPADDIVDAELVEDDEPHVLGADETVDTETGEIIPIRRPLAAVPDPGPGPRRVPRPAAERTLAVIQSQAAKAAREAQTLTPDQIRRVKAEAGHVVASLRQSIEVLQHLANSLDPEENK